MAALRALLEAAGSKPQRIISYTNLLVENLAPTDTVHAVVITDTKIGGTVTISFGTEFKSGLSVEITTENGNVVWTPGNVCVQGVKDGKKFETVDEFEKTSGVKEEVRAFLEAVERNDGTYDKRQWPEEAYKDLVVLQTMLRSGPEIQADINDGQAVR